jgi:hypothetical protein
MSVEKAMQAYATLIEALTKAVRDAAKAGMTQDDIKAALEMVTGLVESSDEE